MRKIRIAYLVFGSLCLWLLAGSATAASAPSPCSLAGANACQATELSFWGLYDQIQIFTALGKPVAELWVNLHLKISLPLATFFTTLLVAPLGLLVARLGASVSTAISIALVFVWYVLYAIFSALGKSGVVDPMLAAWIQNLVFGAAGLGIWAWMNRDRLSFWRV